MKKRFLSLFLAVISAFSLVLPAFATESVTANVSDNIDQYDQYTISFEHNEWERAASNFIDDVETAKEYVLGLKLEEKNFGYIAEACLSQLDDLASAASEAEYILNEYTVLVPKTQAATPTYYGTESGVDFYSSLTSKATYSVKKLSITGNNLSKWTKASVDLVMTFLNVPELTIPWSLVNSVVSPDYEVYTDDIVEAWASLSPTIRTLYVKEGTTFKAIKNTAFGLVHPYFVYHYCDIDNPSTTKYLGKRTLPESSKSSQLAVAIYAYRHGGTLLNDKLENHIGYEWS
ncbi:MAG: hypothetical protein SO072_02430 [Dysosmobacter sp.]|nr:hypothetical protein [Dysosmobacter sp.]